MEGRETRGEVLKEGKWIKNRGRERRAEEKLPWIRGGGGGERERKKERE